MYPVTRVRVNGRPPTEGHRDGSDEASLEIFRNVPSYTTANVSASLATDTVA